MLVRLLSGEFEAKDAKVSESGNSVDRRCMLVYCGEFDSLDGKVQIKPENVLKLAENHNSTMKKLGRLAEGVSPLKFSPPIQLDHSTSAKDTVGRLVGDLEVGEHTLEDGSKVPALFGTARILGKDNVEKTQDGRWTHLSIGADLEKNTISELTITPFPAAAEASLLSRMVNGKIFKSGEAPGKIKWEIYRDEDGLFHGRLRFGLRDRNYWINIDSGDLNKVQKQIDREITAEQEDLESRGHKLSKLSEGDKEMTYKEMAAKMGQYAKAKKQLMDEQKMSEEDAEKKLAEIKDDDLSALAAMQDDKEKKMAAEDEEKKKKLAAEEEAKMAALKSMKAHAPGLTKLAKSFKDSQIKLALAAKTSSITVRLAKLKADAKVTPAEIKKINIAELAGKEQKAIDDILSTYEKREPVIPVGLHGTTKALSTAQLHAGLKKLNLTRLELEARLNMPSKREEALKQLSALEESEKEVNVHIDAVPGGEHDVTEYEKMWGEMKQLMDSGKHDEAKDHVKKYMQGLMAGKGAADVPVEEMGAQMSALAEEVKKMQTDFVDFVKLTAPHFDLKVEELV